MLRGNSGKRLIQRSIERALTSAKRCSDRARSRTAGSFDIWQPEAVDKAGVLAGMLGEDWHGFKDADADHMYLDPVKVTILDAGHGRAGECG